MNMLKTNVKLLNKHNKIWIKQKNKLAIKQHYLKTELLKYNKKLIDY